MPGSVLHSSHAGSGIRVNAIHRGRGETRGQTRFRHGQREISGSRRLARGNSIKRTIVQKLRAGCVAIFFVGVR